MSHARNLARKLFGRSIEVIDLKLAFHKEANLYGTHGQLVASHIDLGLKNALVRFVFIGMSEPPALTPRIMEYVWEEARAQGFVPHSLAWYGDILSTHTGLPPRALVSQERRSAEDQNFGRMPEVHHETKRTLAVAQARQVLEESNQPVRTPAPVN